MLLVSTCTIQATKQNKTKSDDDTAGVVTRVSVILRKVTVKIGDAENRCWGC